MTTSRAAGILRCKQIPVLNYSLNSTKQASVALLFKIASSEEVLFGKWGESSSLPGLWSWRHRGPCPEESTFTSFRAQQHPQSLSPLQLTDPGKALLYVTLNLRNANIIYSFSFIYLCFLSWNLCLICCYQHLPSCSYLRFYFSLSSIPSLWLCLIDDITIIHLLWSTTASSQCWRLVQTSTRSVRLLKWFYTWCRGKVSCMYIVGNEGLILVNTTILCLSLSSTALI